MKKSMKMLLAAFLFVLVLAPAAKVEAANEDDLRNFEVNDVILDNPTSAYSGGSISNLQQTGATATSITISWSAASGAKEYSIYQLDNSGSSVQKFWGTTSNTTYTFSNLSKDSWAWIAVLPVDAAGEEGSGYKVNVATLPSKVTVAYNDYFAENKKLDVAWYNLVAEGYKVELLNKSGKKLDSCNVEKTSTISSKKFSKANTQNVYKVAITPYITVKNGAEKKYGAKTIFYAVPQPKTTSTKKDVGTNGINLKWKKVSGAAKYDILVSTQQKKGWKKAATIKGSKTAYSVISYKNKPINTINKTYYVKIVTYAKFGKKTVKSQNNAYMSFKTYYTSY